MFYNHCFLLGQLVCGLGHPSLQKITVRAAAAATTRSPSVCRRRT